MAMTDINTGTSAPRGSLLLLLRLESNCDMYRVKARKRIGTSRIDQTVLKLRTCERGKSFPIFGPDGDTELFLEQRLGW